MTMIHVLNRVEVPAEWRGRYLDVSATDSAAAIAGNWATSTPRIWKTPDATLTALQVTVIDTASINAWMYNNANPGFTATSDITGALTCAQGAANGANVGTVTAVNGSAPYVWSLNNSDTGRFAINASTGQVTRVTAGGTITTGVNRTIGVTVVDKFGYSFSKNMTVVVT
jgi:hypothetical protein